MKMIPIAAVITILVVSATACGQDEPGSTPFFPFEDSFEGRIDDDDPVTWNQGAEGGNLTPSNGDIILSAAENEFSSAFPTKGGLAVTGRDITARTQVSVTGGFAGLVSRIGDGVVGYFGAIRSDGQLSIGEGVGDDEPLIIADTLNTNLTPATGDVILELRTVGNMITLSAWDAMAPKPGSPPTLSFTDDSLEIGTFSMTHASDGIGTAVFRSFEVVPEPSAAGLLLLGTLAFVASTRRNGRRSSCAV